MEANFQKIIDKISEAFSFFDFSFLSQELLLMA